MQLLMKKFTGSGVEYHLAKGYDNLNEKEKEFHKKLWSEEKPRKLLPLIKEYAKNNGYSKISIKVNCGAPSERIEKYVLINNKFVKNGSFS